MKRLPCQVDHHDYVEVDWSAYPNGAVWVGIRFHHTDGTDACASVTLSRDDARRMRKQLKKAMRHGR